jgi:hypothetical protein
MDYLPMHPRYSNKIWYIVGGTVFVVVAVLVARYYYSQQQSQPSSAAIQTQTAPTTVDTTVAGITADFNQTSDGSAALTADKATSAQAVSAF